MPPTILEKTTFSGGVIPLPYEKRNDYGTERRLDPGGTGRKGLRGLLPHLSQDTGCKSRRAYPPLLRQGDGSNGITVGEAFRLPGHETRPLPKCYFK